MRHGRDLAGKGGRDLSGVGYRLAEALDGIRDEGGAAITIGRFVQAPSEPAKLTAAAVGKHVSILPEPESEESFGPARASPFSGTAYNDEFGTAKRRVPELLTEAEAKGGNAVLIVGHQPLMSSLATILTGGHVALTHSEVACLVQSPGRKRWRLEWTIAPTDEATDGALRAKLTSKMQVAGILGGVVTATLVFLLESIADRQPTPVDLPLVLRGAAALFLVLAAAFFLVAMYFCDRLMMPPRFWQPDVPTESRSPQRPAWLVRRPPAPATWIVYQNMQRVWRFFFEPACVALLLGVILLGIALFEPRDLQSALLPTSAAAGLCVVGVLVIRLGRPRLGVDD
jgi:phosphohistidine phosphatase SixA